jgi:hypothetical protein
MVSQAKYSQVEPHPTKRLLKMAPERLLVERAEAGQVCEIDPAPQRKHRPKQFLQKLALPKANPTVVNVGHLPENSGYHRREKRLWKHRS